LIRLSKTSLNELEKKAILKVLDFGYLGMGKDVEEFENKLSSFFERPVACVVNGTAALHLSLEAIGVSFGDEVIVPSLTYIGSFQSISASRAKPVPCEVDSETLTIDLNSAEKLLTPNTKAIMPVHYSGGVGALDEVYLFAKKYNLRVIEDAAHAFGTSYKNNRIGSVGDISCFSFDGIKNITSGEGGCIVTDDIEIINKVRDARLLGVEKDTQKRYSGERSWNFKVSSQGYRYHMSNIMASIGIVQLEKFHELSKKRQSLAKYYDKLLREINYIKRINHNYDQVVPHIYTIRIQGTNKRDSIRESLLKKGIETGVHYFPNHHLDFYKNTAKKPLPITDRIYSELITLPLHPDLKEAEIDFIVHELIEEINK